MSTHLLPGSFSGRNGAKWSQSFADHRRTAEMGAATEPLASPSQAVLPPSTEAVQRAIIAGLCPFCGDGPYKSLGQHTAKAHAVTAAELRDLSGLKSICSRELSDESRERLISRPDRDEITRRGAAASRLVTDRRGLPVGAQALAAAACAKRGEEQRAERAPVVVMRARRGDRLIDIAADLGVHPATIREDIKRLGVKPTLAQTNADRLARLVESRSVAREAQRIAAEAERDRRIARFQALGGNWSAVRGLAGEVGVSEVAMRGYLRKHGVGLPDGRSVTDLRPKERPDMKGRPNKAARSVTDEQMDEIRALWQAGDLSQHQIGERFGISQSIVSRVVRGAYVATQPTQMQASGGES